MGSLSDAGHPEVAFFSSFLDGGLVQIFSQILYLRVNTKSDVNFISSRHIERENFSFPVDVPRSKTPLLKFPINATDIFPAAFTKPAWNGGDEEVVAGKISWAKSSKQGGARLSFPPWVCLRSKRFRAVSEQRTRNEGQRPRENWYEWKSGEARPKPKIPFLGLSLPRNQTETLATQANHEFYLEIWKKNWVDLRCSTFEVSICGKS